jgi:hypothetical protein
MYEQQVVESSKRFLCFGPVLVYIAQENVPRYEDEGSRRFHIWFGVLLDIVGQAFPGTNTTPPPPKKNCPVL